MHLVGLESTTSPSILLNFLLYDLENKLRKGTKSSVKQVENSIKKSSVKLSSLFIYLFIYYFLPIKNNNNNNNNNDNAYHMEKRSQDLTNFGNLISH